MAGKGKKQLGRALQGLLGEKQDKLKQIPALLGVYRDGVKTITVAGREDFVWCRLRGSDSELVQAFNETVGHHWDLPILISRDPDTPDIYKVSGRDIGQYEDWGGEFYSSRPHGRSHSFGRPEGADPVWIYKRQNMSLLPRPVISGTLGIYIEPEFYYFGGRYHWWPGSGTASLASFKPTGSVNGRFVTVYIDGASGNPTYLSGDEFNAYIPPKDPGDYIDIPNASQGIPIAAVFLLTGTERIGWGEIYDLRQPETPVPTTGSALQIYDDHVSQGQVGGIDFLDLLEITGVTGTTAFVDVAPPVTGSFVAYDEGTLLGSALGLNVTGDQGELVISGSIAHLMLTGSSQAVPTTGSVTVYDEGALLGQADAINVVGDNAEVVLSGSVAHIMHTGAAGGGGDPPITGSVEIFDEGSLLGSVLGINFAGADVEAVISGSYAHVMITGAVATDVATYVRAGTPTALATLTGVYWEVPDQEYATGTLSVAINGILQRPITDYTEQFPSSGTFQLIESPITGSVFSTIYGVEVPGGNPVSTFLGLTDTPSSYSGQGGEVVSVNEGEDALEFVNRVPGALVQYFFATGTTDIGRASASWADMDEMILTGTFGTDNIVEIHFSFGVGGSSANNVGAFRIAIDGVAVGEETKLRTPSISVGPAGHLMWIGKLSGIRVITGQWNGAGPGTTHNRPAAKDEHRQLMVKEYQS